ncbi:MAG: MFS transporter [Myxococcota bacterium]|nr:MFS transporter [Myxococcota bacterium]
MIKTKLLPIFVMAAVLDSGFGSIFALLAKIRGEFGFDVMGVAMIGGAGFVSAFIAQISLSRYADRGYTRVLLWTGTGIAILSMFMMAWSESLIAFIGARFIFGMGEGIFLPAARRLVILSSPEDTGGALGQLSAFQMFGFLIGPLLGSVLGEYLGLRMTFLINGAMILACAPLIMKVPMVKHSMLQAKNVIRQLLAQQNIRGILIAVVGYYGSFGIYESIWAIYLDDLGASQLFIGFQLTLFSLPMIVVAPFAGKFAERKGGLTVALVAIAISIPAVAMYGMTSNIILLTIILMVHAIADAAVVPSIQLATSRVAGDAQASAQGLLNACGLITAACVALGSGAVYQNFGPFWLFAGWAIVMIFSTAGATFLGQGELKQEARLRSGETT